MDITVMWISPHPHLDTKLRRLRRQVLPEGQSALEGDHSLIDGLLSWWVVTMETVVEYFVKHRLDMGEFVMQRLSSWRITSRVAEMEIF